MDVFEQNLAALLERYPEYESVLAEVDEDMEVKVVDAILQGSFLAVNGRGISGAMSSTCDGTHEAERFCGPYASAQMPVPMALFGFGLGYIPEQMAKMPSSFSQIHIYEPSVSILRGTMMSRDLTGLFRNERVTLSIGERQFDGFIALIEKDMTFHNWETFGKAVLYRYEYLYTDLYRRFLEEFARIQSQKQVDFNTLAFFSKVSVRNEIHFFRYLKQAKNVYGFAGRFPEQVPCIVVAAGPSLEKNVDAIKEAKGKAVIIGVDRVADFLLDHGIIPDLLCTIDPNKGGCTFTDERLKDVPVLAPAESNCVLLDGLGSPKVIYLGGYPSLHESILSHLDVKMGGIALGGSVALCAFNVAVELGFSTIILAGQDLALGEKTTHAGEGDVEETTVENEIWVEGYNGGRVRTRKDFLMYIGVYEGWMRDNKDLNIINATEGGAKLHGMRQMPLREAVETYCTSDFSFETMYNEMPYIIRNREDMDFVDTALQRHIGELKELRPNVEKAYKQTKRSLHNLKVGRSLPAELERTNQDNNKILDRVRTCEASDMLYQCMIRTEESITAVLDEEYANPLMEMKALYTSMMEYLEELLGAFDYVIGVWDEVYPGIESREEINWKP